jgi:hypothetical protein
MHMGDCYVCGHVQNSVLHIGTAKYKAAHSARARRSDPDTSHQAAERLDTTALEAKVYRVLLLHGPPRGKPMCVVEIWKLLPELSVDTVSPRMIQMLRKGFIICLGKEPRGNRHGRVRSQLVYAIAAKQMELFK